jgi:glycosyltransferase involved in cell wall biosynthesis
MNKVRFSIIVPNYNKDIYISECLNSIINQTYKNYEIIVVDDGSTDNSLEEIKKFDVKFFCTNRLQAGGARNLGLKNANGEYIIFLDSDDYLHDNKVLEDLNNLISDEDLIFFNYEMDKYGEISNVLDVDGDIYERIAKSTFLGVPTKCFKKSLIENLKFPECQRYEDIVFTIEAMCKAEKYKYMEKPFFTYRKVLESNSTSKIDIKAMTSIITELLKVYNLCVKYPKYKESLLRRLKHDKLDKRIIIMNYMLDNNIEFLEVSEFYKLFNEK